MTNDDANLIAKRAANDAAELARTSAAWAALVAEFLEAIKPK